MLDSHIRPLIDPPLQHAAKWLVEKGVTPNGMTALGFFLGIVSWFGLATQNYTLAIIFLGLSRLADGLDGPMAREAHATDLGGFLDIVADFVFYSGFVFFFAMGEPAFAFSASFLIFSFIGTGTSFLAYAIMAAKRGDNYQEQGEKSFFYMAGIMEGTETILFFILMCLFPAAFSWMAYIFGCLCWATTCGRVRQAITDFS